MADGNGLAIPYVGPNGDLLPVQISAIIVGLTFDVSDRPGRLLGIIYGDLGQLNQVVPIDALTPAAVNPALSVAGLNFVFNGASWDMMREGNVAGSIFSDVTDRAARLLGVVYGSAGAQILQVTPAEALANPGDALATASFSMIWDASATDWNRWIESPTQGVPYVEELPAEAIADITDLVAAAAATQLIAGSTPCRAVTVTSLAANAAPIRVGGATVAVNRGAEINPGDSITLGVNNVNLVYVFGNGADLVSITYVN